MSRGIGKQKIQSPYSAAFTAASMMYREMNALIPLMQDEHAQELINQEIEENRLLRINSLMSRKRVVSELQRRYNSVPKSFWDHYLSLSEKAQRVALFYVIQLGLKNKWKDFEDFWGIKNLAQEKWTFQQTGAMPARYQEIDSIFAD